MLNVATSSRDQRKIQAGSLPIARKEPLQIRIPTSIKRRFKSYAALRGLDANELFIEVWQQYEKNLPPPVIEEEIAT